MQYPLLQSCPYSITQIKNFHSFGNYQSIYQAIYQNLKLISLGIINFINRYGAVIFQARVNTVLFSTGVLRHCHMKKHIHFLATKRQFEQKRWLVGVIIVIVCHLQHTLVVSRIWFFTLIVISILCYIQSNYIYSHLM